MTGLLRRLLGAAVLLGALLPLTGCSGEPAPEARVVAVTELGVMERPSTIVGRDGGVSGLFAGRSVWVYGDSVATEKGTFPSTWRNNTMSWTADLDASDGIGGFVQPVDAEGAPLEFFPRTQDEQAFNEAHIDLGDGSCEEPCGARYAIWGSGPLQDPANNRALLTYSKVYSEPGEWNFKIVGTSIAVWEDFEEGPVRPLVTSNLGDPTLLFDAAVDGELGVGASIVDGRLYLFACSGGLFGDSHACRLGRAGLDDIFRRDAWQFRAADGWSDRVEEAAVLFNGSPNMTVYFNRHLGRWIAVYIDWGTIVLRTAEQIDGPWSAPLQLFQPAEDGAIHALAHEEYAEDDGAVEYVSYLSDEFRLLRVELAP